MNETDAALVMLTAAIFFALIIERLLEIAKCIYDYVEARNDWSEFWNRRAVSIRERLQNRLEKTKDNKLQKTVFKYLASRYVNTDHPGYEGAQVISAKKVRTFMVKGVSKFLSVALGLAVAFGVGINVFDLIGVWTKTNSELPIPMGLFKAELPNWLELTISGIVMGLGSGPMHKFIAALERAKRKRKSTDAA